MKSTNFSMGNDQEGIMSFLNLRIFICLNAIENIHIEVEIKD